MKKLLTAMLASALFVACAGPNTFENPVIRGDVPDPTVLRLGDVYYAAGTSSEWAPFYPLFKSEDLVNWSQIGHVFKEQPVWTESSFWAPELFENNGKVYCYYTARRASDHKSIVGVAVTDDIEKGFTDCGPLVDFGTEDIDSYVFKDDDGQVYVSWKAYGLDRRPNAILACRLSADGLSLDGEPFMLLEDEEHLGMEGQLQIKVGDWYYMLYSARGCCGKNSNYEVRLARAKSFAGPYERHPDNPILMGDKEAGEVQSIGHGTLVEGPQGRLFYLCHAYLNNEGFYGGRQPFLSELEPTEDGWLRFKKGKMASIVADCPDRKTVQEICTSFSDDFDSTLRPEWSWNYIASDVKAESGSGELHLYGTSVSALCLRPFCSDYVCRTKVKVNPEVTSGLVLYGGPGNYVSWGVKDYNLSLIMHKGREEQVLSALPYANSEIYLMAKITDGCNASFGWSFDGEEWHGAIVDGLDMSESIMWDRVFRPGLITDAVSADSPACFESFSMAKIVKNTK